MGRFDYVKYDETAELLQHHLKTVIVHLEDEIQLIGSITVCRCGDKNMVSSALRSKAMAITKLEECYTWIGKAIRDDQLARNAFADSEMERSNF